MRSFLIGSVMAGFVSAILLAGAAGPASGQTRPRTDGAQTERGGDRQAQPRDGGGEDSGGRRGERPAFVTVDAVTRGEAVETVPVYGRVVARQSGIVASRVRGAVQDVEVQVGSRVNKGDPLIVLIPDMLQSERALKAAELQEFRARIATSEAQLQLTEQELARIDRLRQSAAFSAARQEDKRREVERYRSAVREAAARAKQAEAELRIADINLANAVIRAPYDGVITQRHTESGAYLGVGDRVVTMTNDSSLEIEAEVPARWLKGLSPGTRVAVDPEIAPSFEAIVRAVVPEENQLSRTRTVRFVPDAGKRPALVAANQSVVLRIPANRPRTVTTAHKDALLHRRGENVMFVYADGKVSPRTVELGEAFGNRFEIISGLEPGERVVTRGNERLRPDQAVRLRGPDREDRSSGEPRSSRERGGSGLPGMGRAKAAERPAAAGE